MLVQLGGLIATATTQMVLKCVQAYLQLSCALKARPHRSRTVSWTTHAVFAMFVLSLRTRAASGPSRTDCQIISTAHHLASIIDEAADNARLNVCLSTCAPQTSCIRFFCAPFITDASRSAQLDAHKASRLAK